MQRLKNIDKKNIMRGLRFAVIVSLLISAAIILFTMDKETLNRLLEEINLRFLIYLLLVMCGSWFFAGLRLKILVNTIGDKISIIDSIIVYLGGSFVSFVTPFATGGGPFQVYFLHKKGVKIGRSSTVIVIQFVLRLFFFGTLTPIFLIFFNWAISPGAIPGYIFYSAFGFGILFSIGIILFSLVPEILNKIIRMVLSIDKLKQFIKNNRKAKRFLVKARRELREFRESLKILVQNKIKLFQAALCTVAYWGLMFLVMPLVLIGLGLEPNFIRAFVMQTIIYLILPYMPTPGASGFAEVGFASLFIVFIPKNMIGLVTFGWRIYTFYLVLLVGGIIALKEINSNRSYENE